MSITLFLSLVVAATTSAAPIATSLHLGAAGHEVPFAFKRRFESIIRRSGDIVCGAETGDAAVTICPHVNSTLRALFALFCLLALLVLLHVWQAATYRKVRK